MTDPDQVARAIYGVQRAMEGWQDAALAAISTCREEHQATSETVERSGQAAMEARVWVEHLTEEVGRLQSSVEDTRHELAAAAITVDTSTLRHQALTDHVARSQAVWSGHLERARWDYQRAIEQRQFAAQEERAAFQRLQAAQSEAQGTASGPERGMALATWSQRHAEYNQAYMQLERAAAWEGQQQARVERCTRALALTQQAAELLESGTAHLRTATEAMDTGRARLSEAEQATDAAQAHLSTMDERASEAVNHANRADEHLTTATRHLDDSEDWLQRGYVLANDAALDMSDQIRQLQRADEPMGGGGDGHDALDVAQAGAEPNGAAPRGDAGEDTALAAGPPPGETATPRPTEPGTWADSPLGKSPDELAQAANQAAQDPVTGPLLKDYQPPYLQDPDSYWREYWDPEDDRWRYPDAGGSVPGTQREVTLPVGYLIDRFGSDYGTYFARVDTPYTARSLPPTQTSAPYHQYEVIKALPVTQSKTLPWFGEKGLGTQFETTHSVTWLVEHGYIKRLK